ncbi:hypothetical protein KC573_02430, partial [candidate division WWE3 bacterium]|nr:hypothetical protein [candidate division WWE3 bacterium]
MYRELHKDLCLDSLIPRLERFNLYPELLWINKDSREFSNEENICQRIRNLETVFENETILIKRLQNPI